MPFDGNGNFVRDRSWIDDAANNIKIRADLHDQNDDDLALALSNVVTRDGQSPPTLNLPMGGKRLTGLGAGVDPGDSVKMQQLSDALSPGYSNIGDFLTTLRNPGASWLKRDGATYLQVNYPALFALIGLTYGRPASLSALANPFSPAGNAWAIGYGAGKLVAVGASGKISYSTNGGTSWTAATSGVSVQLYGVCYGGGLFVVVGDTGTILTSPDAITWTAQTSGFAQNFTAITYGNGIFMAVGLTASTIGVYTSPDGVSWAPRAIATLTAALRGVAYGGGTWVAVGDSGTAVVSKDNGATWRIANAGTTAQLKAVAYGRGRFVAVGASVISVSSAGNSWSAQGTSASLAGVTFGSGGFLLVGAAYAASSTDGIHVNPITGGSTNTMSAATYGSDAFFVVDVNGLAFKTTWSFNTLTEFQVPDDEPGNGYIKAL